jgi:DNA-binding MarR family transcriptional regulator
MGSNVVYEKTRRGSSEAVLVALRRIMRAIDLHSHQLVQQLGVTGPQLIVLQELARSGAVPVGNLAKAVSLSHATVTGIVTRLEKRQLVQRSEDDQDRRRVLVGVTPAGEALLATAPPPIQESFVTEFERLEDWESSLILSSLQRVVAMMEATELEAAPILATGPIEN